MSGAFQSNAFQNDAFQVDSQPPAAGFIPRGSIGSITTPAKASGSISVPAYTSTVTVPERPTAEVD